MNRMLILEESELVVQRAGHGALEEINRLAASYPHPHSILGTSAAEGYVLKLMEQAYRPGEGWYVATRQSETRAAAYLSIYGVGNGRGHTLWKIRHPLLAPHHHANDLSALFRSMIGAAVHSRLGSAKFVLFLGECEKDVISQCPTAGFRREACLKDYYRFGEDCFIYGLTVVGEMP